MIHRDYCGKMSKRKRSFFIQFVSQGPCVSNITVNMAEEDKMLVFKGNIHDVSWGGECLHIVYSNGKLEVLIQLLYTSKSNEAHVLKV